MHAMPHACEHPCEPRIVRLQCQPPESIEPIVCSHVDHVVLLRQVLSIVLLSAAYNPGAAVDPLHDRARRLYRASFGYKHLYREAILLTLVYTSNQVQLRAQRTGLVHHSRFSPASAQVDTAE